MRLTVLGSGTVVPDGSRNSAGYFVELPGARLMLDCGAGTVHALARYGLPWEQLTHLFISHFHVDHAGELASLFFAFKWGTETERVEPLWLMGPRGLDKVVKALDEAFGPNLFKPKFPVNLMMYEPGGRSHITEHAILSVAKTPHTRESLAVRIDTEGHSICYTGDTGYSESLAEFFKGADLLVSECSFQERREGVPHLSTDEASRMAETAGVARLLVTHFYFPVDEHELRESLRRSYSGEVIVGGDGLSIEV